MIYQELRSVAAGTIRQEFSRQRLSPHAIVHETAIRMMCDEFALALDVSVLTVGRHRWLARTWLDGHGRDRRLQ
jgi:hypothetical protein